MNTWYCYQLSSPGTDYLAVWFHVHLATLNERLEVSVRLGGDGPALPGLSDHGKPPVMAPLVVELPQVGLAVHLDAVLHVRVTPHQALHIPHVKLLQLG